MARTLDEIQVKLHTLEVERDYYRRARGALTMLRALQALQQSHAPPAAYAAMLTEFGSDDPDGQGARQAYRWFHGSEVDLLHVPRKRLRME